MLLKDRLRLFDSVLPSGTMRPSYGSVAEWFKAAVLKTADSQGSQSSNLCASAIPCPQSPVVEAFAWWIYGLPATIPPIHQAPIPADFETR